jgi:hypothetical protein
MVVRWSEVVRLDALRSKGQRIDYACVSGHKRSDPTLRPHPTEEYP